MAFQFDIYEDPELVSPKRLKVEAATSNAIDPFSESLTTKLLQELSPPITKYKGYYNMSSKSAPRTVSSLKSMTKKNKKDENVILDLGETYF